MVSESASLLLPVLPSDEALLYRLACEPIARQNSFTTSPPTPQQHRTWFHAWLAREDVRRWVVAVDEQRIGVVWAERIAPLAARISINLLPGSRYRGIGSGALQQAVSALKADWDALVVAYIKPGNTASERCFAKAGFVKHPSPATQEGQPAVLYAI